jgi:malate synthase
MNQFGKEENTTKTPRKIQIILGVVWRWLNQGQGSLKITFEVLVLDSFA